MKSPQKKRKNAKPKPERRPLRWLLAPRLWIVLGWVGAFGAVAYGLQRLEPHARAVQKQPTHIEWVGLPEWLESDNWRHVLPNLEASLAIFPDTDMYDGRVCPYVAQEVAKSAWIERVSRVTKQSDGVIRVHADFRKPYVIIEQGATAYLVDEQGIRLPEAWPVSAINRAGWLVVRGVQAGKPSAGNRWRGDDLAEGLKLARFLYRAETEDRLQFRACLAAIDVSNYRGRRNPSAGHLQIVTNNPPNCIYWGLPPGEEYDIEGSAELKLAKLNKLYTELGQMPERGPLDVRSAGRPIHIPRVSEPGTRS